MAANRENQPVTGDDRDLAHLRAAMTNLEQRFTDFTRDIRDAIAALGQVPPQPNLPHRAGVVPPAPPVNPPARRRNEHQRHGGPNHYRDESSSEEELEFEDLVENLRNNRKSVYEYKLKMDLASFDGRIDIEGILDWIQTTEHFFEYMNIPEHKRVSLVAYKLKAGAAAWWEQVQFTRRRQGKQHIRTWTKMKQYIRDRYLPANYEHVLSGERVNCVIQKVLLTPSHPISSQRHNLFKTRCTIKQKVCDVIIDSGSCENIVSKSLVKALQLPTVKHPHPYKIGWIKKGTEMLVNEVCKVSFSIDKFY